VASTRTSPIRRTLKGQQGACKTVRFMTGRDNAWEADLRWQSTLGYTGSKTEIVLVSLRHYSPAAKRYIPYVGQVPAAVKEAAFAEVMKLD